MKRTEMYINKTLTFGALTYRLMYLLRWNIYPRCNQETCASHISQVSLLSLYLCELLENKVKFNKEKVLTMSISHDLAEAPSAIDVVHKIKEEYPAIKTEIELIELIEMEKLMGKKYCLLLEEFNEGKTIESIIVQLADVLACKIYCVNEITMGNKHFNLPLKESEARLKILIKKLNKFTGGKNGKCNKRS